MACGAASKTDCELAVVFACLVVMASWICLIQLQYSFTNRKPFSLQHILCKFFFKYKSNIKCFMCLELHQWSRSNVSSVPRCSWLWVFPAGKQRSEAAHPAANWHFPLNESQHLRGQSVQLSCCWVFYFCSSNEPNNVQCFIGQPVFRARQPDTVFYRTAM